MRDKMMLSEHLDEIRERLLISLGAAIACSIVCYFYLDPILSIITKPVGKLVFLSVLEAFSVKIKIAFYCGILLAAPVIIYQIYKFIKPALFPDEKKYFSAGVIASYILFIVGVVFGFYAIVPVGVRILLSYGGENINPFISFESYVNFVTTLLLGFGVIFQLPVVVALLTKLGILNPGILSAKRRHVIIGIFLIAGIITPGPDIFSQCLVAIPGILLYELSIVISKYLYSSLAKCIN